ncbi:MAG: phosphoglycerol transferase [Alphaproteobacteria bacterium]|jgi:phosphoglycerol transferase
MIKRLLSAIFRVAISSIIFFYLIAQITFPTATFDDYFIHLKAICYSKTSNQSETSQTEKNNPIQSQYNGASIEEIKQDSKLQFLSNNLPFDAKKIPFILNFNNHNKLIIIVYIFSVFSVIGIISILIFIDFLVKKKILTPKRTLIILTVPLLYVCINIVNMFYKHDYLKQYYIEANDNIIGNNITAQPEKNLLFLYVESLESSFSNTENFKENLLRPLENLGGIQMPLISNVGTTNSLTGVFASLCSIPLYINYNENLSDNSLFNNKICLGNILKYYHYKQGTIQGTDERSIYTQEFKKIFNKNNITFSGCKELVDKGYKTSNDTFDGCFHNQEILAETEMQLKAFQKTPKDRFFLSNFLIDTHGPRGLFSKNCTDNEHNDSNQIRGSVKCAVRNIEQRIKSWQKKGYLDNTVIVIMGDHLFMPGFSNSDYFQDDRHVYFQLIDANNTQLSAKRDTMNHFDVMPTVLDALGILPQNQNRLGLGSSIFREDQEFEKRQEKFKDDSYLFSDL